MLTYALLEQLEKSDQDNDMDGGNENENENERSTGKRKLIDDEMENYDTISEYCFNIIIIYYLRDFILLFTLIKFFL